MAGAAAALAIWPLAVSHQSAAATFTPAPVTRDYESRDRLIAFFERQVRADPRDQIQRRMLAQQYMQRFRERYDLGDVARASVQAQRSIALQPQGNTSAQMTLASAALSYHEFTRALGYERAALAGEPFNANARAQIASLQMEMGDYGAARRTLDEIRGGASENPTVDSVRARFYELTGRLSDARTAIARATRTIDSGIDNPAYDRSWYHMRAGQLAFESGDFDAADAEYRTSLEIYPQNAMALLWQARLYRAQKRWDDSLRAASRSADLYPLPQALGYKADAERALGKNAEAAQTDALIDAEAKLFDARGINDRLLANYYTQRGTHLAAALTAARADYAKRGDEVYADDTLAWALAASGRWREALPFAERAARLGTQDGDLQFHTATIELKNGRRAAAARRLAAALNENPAFDPFEAERARAQLAAL